MAKRKPKVRIRSYGIYSQWDSKAKDLPRIMEFTNRVPAEIDIEFGFVVNIQSAKNEELEYCIAHPGILDAEGDVREPFTGIVFVKTNDWNFYLGDTLWDPIQDKLGAWRMTLELNGELIADKTFDIVQVESL